MNTSKPTHDLSLVKKYVKEGKFNSTKRVRSFISNHYDDLNVSKIISEILLSIETTDFYKTVELEIMPGQKADIYRDVYCDKFPDETWYIKLYVDQEMLLVDILSLCWEGSIH